MSLTPSTAEGSGWGAVIDNVLVIPEPGTLALLWPALVGLAARRRTRFGR